ncbi:c-type cytochrome [Acidicapsa dinghuensis]|uniref:C-type cytochrome n=1 Tax=Acidicapsa dinghuensis TaxID=2218256 RepID=A0ABW1ECA7_9BACT|nr:c-type cytochrome [Acidicapsa dinghuensis]
MNLNCVRPLLVLLPALLFTADGFAPLPAVHAVQSHSPSDWPVYGGQLEGDHYSPLTQINQRNVTKLKVAWTFDTHETGGLQTTPLIIGRVLYGITPSQKIFALDAVTGKQLWQFDSGVKGTQPGRGLTWWSQGTESRLFVGVMNFLYCLDPATGNPIASFGENGRIDLRKNLRGDYTKQSIVLTSPGIIYKDLIIVGGRNPETHPAPPGDVRAFDVHTGALRWAFHTIPHPGEYGYETWPKDAWLTAGAANNWAGMSLDPERGILYVPTGSAVDDFYGADRVGNDLFANTLLALDASTGKRLWHFQDVHHDMWDRDFPSRPALVTINHDGKQVDTIAQTTKQGYLYLFNRVTGQPLFPIEELPYPPSTVPGEVASPTQPKPTLPAPYARQRLTEDMLTNRTPEAHKYALDQFRTFRSNGQFIPLAVGQQTVVFPGFDGGAEWGGPAVDVKRGILYVNANEMAWTGGLIENTDEGGPGKHTYDTLCSVCHGDRRQGSPPAFPSLIDVNKRLSDNDIINTIHQGKGRMPSFPMIDDAHIVTLLDYLKSGDANQSSKQEMSASTNQSPQTNAVGAKSYAAHCAVCHGSDMQGIAPSFPSLRGVGARKTSAEVAALIHHGKPPMPAFPTLDGEELKALLQYLGISSEPATATNAEENPLRYRFTGYRKFLDQDGYPAIAPPWGTLSAIDLNTGKYLWQIPLGEYPGLAYPDLAAKGMTSTGSENYGGPIITASNLLFIGATCYDRKFRAFDSRTGHLLWETTLPYSATATPATYEIDGKQYVVIAAGGGRDPKVPSGGEYIAFALPDTK